MFLRTMTTCTSTAEGIIDILTNLFNYTAIGVVSSQDSFNAPTAEALVSKASAAGIATTYTPPFQSGTTDFTSQHRLLLQSGNRIIVIFCYESDAGRFLVESYRAGIGGEGFLWIGGVALTTDIIWQQTPELLADPALRLRLLQGTYGLSTPSADAYEATNFRARQRRLPSSLGNGSNCDLETDHDGNLLWAQDHDNDPSTPLVCAGTDHQQGGSYGPFAYDAVFALAHALHDLLEARHRTQIVGAELYETLIQKVRFDGVSGLVDFHDASADPDRRNHGDRLVGVRENVFNYKANEEGFVVVGMWVPAATESSRWADRWSPAAGVGLTYSTADNSRPPQMAMARLVTINIGVLLPLFQKGTSSLFDWSPRVGTYQALRELNDKNDGVADDLLPNTQLRVAYADSACDPTDGLTGAVHLTQYAFGGEGVSAIIGTGCSGAAMSAALVAGASNVPLISPTATSPDLSNRNLYPYFVRCRDSHYCCLILTR